MKSPLIVRIGSLKQGENNLKFEFSARDIGLADREVTENPSFEELAGTVQVNASIVRSGPRLMIGGTVAFRARLGCSLCGTDYESDFNEPLDAEFVSTEPAGTGEDDLDDGPAERTRVHGDFLDLAPLVRDAIHLAVPMAPACRADCRGLCPHCGANLNDGPCNCQAG